MTFKDRMNLPMKPETIERRRLEHLAQAADRSRTLRARMAEKIAIGRDPDGIWAEMLAEFDATHTQEA